MNSETTLKREILETQIAVIGGGGAGMAAAVTAAEKGAKVLLLEKRRKLGGNSALAWAIFGAETRPQLRQKVDAKRDDFFKVAMRFASWTINPRIVRAFIDRSAECIHWLEDKGLTFNVFAMWPNQVPRPAHIPKRGGKEIIEVLTKESESLGVKILRETGAVELLTDDEGKVVGVLALKRSGEELEIRADSVIIATGGYGGNKELLKKYSANYSENIKLLGVANTGDGLLMAIKIGAATEGLGVLHTEAAGFVPGAGDSLMAVVQEPYTLWLNKKGERFVDEAFTTIFNVFEAAPAVIRQPESICYAIIDERMKQYIEQVGFIHGWRKYGPTSKAPKLSERLQSAAQRGVVKISHSWDEIAGWMGAKPEVLKASIDEYNSFCDKGHDEIFAKESRYLSALRTPPYYAIKNFPVMLGTIGGIKINHHTEVLDTQENPIPGVYAAGIDSGGWEPETYNSHLGGHAFGFSIYSGRIAGENAAHYVNSLRTGVEKK